MTKPESAKMEIILFLSGESFPSTCKDDVVAIHLKVTESPLLAFEDTNIPVASATV